ncbi:MAG: xanthine dehydrogenase family protein subunit M [Gammaproteobacteria bacterium]|nr:xanthine dehydrogenase family protein subunit M [Gammaproteobacteria bacterium]MBT4493656.1 xanthine dehydrogenase family protein subunit M [Gammaproteobacteria bacterium]MBT7372233.1 xanthine dehydrogenase family protein subunit M [Gammaproteobacteria bacterium]
MRYESPTTTKEAVALLAGEKGSAYVLAGGTDLMVRLRMDLIEPDLMVDIKRIPVMNEVKKTATGFKIGAAVSSAELGENKALGKAWPGVVEAARLIGSDQVQSRCTIAGNLCNASPAADSVPALVAAGAKAVVVGKSKRRTVAVDKIVTGPGETSLAKDELVEAITLPKRAARSGDAYLRFIPRTEMDIAVVGCAVSLTLARGVVKTARVALGAVAPTVVLVPEAARALIGTKLDDNALEKMAAACSAACDPIDDKRGTIEYRTRVAGVLAKRAAKIAFERAGGK